MLPIEAGNFSSLSAVSGKVIYHKGPNAGSGTKERPIMLFDLEKREEKTLVSNANSYSISADGKKIMVSASGSYSIVDVAPDQSLSKSMPVTEMENTSAFAGRLPLTSRKSPNGWWRKVSSPLP